MSRFERKRGDREKEHAKWVEHAAGTLIALADDSGRSLVDVIAEVERYIVERTKVGDAARDAVPPGRRGYAIRDGRLVEVKGGREGHR